MLGHTMRHTNFLTHNVIKLGPSAVNFARSYVAQMSTKASYAVGNIVVRVFLLEGDREMPYIGGLESKQTINIYGKDLSNMFFPFVNSLKNSVHSSLIDGSFFSSKADIYSSANVHSAISEEVEYSVRQISNEAASVISDIIIKIYAVPEESSYNIKEPGSEQTFWINTNLEGIDLSSMFVPLMRGIEDSIKKCIIDGACFTSSASVFSPDDNALEQLVGKDAADAGTF